MDYRVIHEDGVEELDLSAVEEVPPDLTIKPLDEALGLSALQAKLWLFEPGEEIGYHAHSEQEELYYAVEGTFSLKLGRSGDTEVREVGPGTFWVARPEVGHGHRYVGDDRGVVLAFGAPPVEDPGMDPHELDGK
jgi:quercetin dioxygenase-like cupin family protein